ncbi:hypothetical protein SALBM311S_10650 [Streptomyces alboniger]
MGKGSLTLLWQKDGSGVAYTESGSSGLLIDNSEDVLVHRLSYDRLRDQALSPSDSLTFIKDVLEEHRSTKHTPDLSTAAWRKSSYSDGGANDFVEIADGVTDCVPVRDSKTPGCPSAGLRGRLSWSAFVTRIRASRASRSPLSGAVQGDH